MSSALDFDPEHPEGSSPPIPQPDLAALTLRVAALEAQLATLTTAPASHTPTAVIPASPPPRPSEPAPVREAISTPPPRQSFEDRLGSQIFNFIGAAALIIGAAWALKLAFEHGLVGPAGRILIGLGAGTGLILWSERFRRRSLPAFSYSLKAVGSGILYLSLWASFQLYHLLPANAIFAAMLLVTAWNAYMAWSQDAELLAAYALAGGLATPLLLSTGGDHEAFLFLYLATLNAATVLLLRAKPWPRLLPAAYLATAFYFIAWYSEFFHRLAPLPPRYFYPRIIAAWDAQSTETTLFILVFSIIFALPSLRGWFKGSEASKPHSIIQTILLPLASASFLSLALYFVFQGSGLHTALPWLMLVFSALYLALMRLQATATARALHLALAVVFLTVAIPLKASGHTLTTAWLVEGLVLYWASTRVRTQTPTESRAPIRVLQLLSAAGYILGLLSLAIHWVWFGQPSPDNFFTPNLGAAIVALASLAALIWLASRETLSHPQSIATLTLAITAIDLVALLLLLGELASFSTAQAHPAFLTPAFLHALLALAVLAAASWSEYRLASVHSEESHPFFTLAASSLIALNLFAILTGVREISALWEGANLPYAEAALQRSLAISAFLMLYGALLLAAGFWRRSAFVRWQALALLIFTILKVFLYDVSGLSQGYRVASFLGLGALLMAVSFAYQKDWLGLKNSHVTETPNEPSEVSTKDPA